jgi:catechol 2,3-dioxygenase-like lactoylglutathione lyase family enzyme
MTTTTNTETEAVGTLWAVTLDCAEPEPLAEFWSAALGGTIAHRSDNFFGVELPGGTWIGAYRIDGYAPPEWPEGESPKQFHLDLSVGDLDAAENALLGLGARKADHQPEPDRWRVLLDPAGHPFCITNMG